MKLFTKEEINKRRHETNRELTAKNEKVVSSLKKVLKLQEEIDFDKEKAKKMKEFQVWCDNLNEKKSLLLQDMKKYQNAVEGAKEELYRVIARKDMFEDEIANLEEEIGRLQLQVQWNKQVLTK